MKIVWDEPKRLATLAVRGLDFADVTFDFFLGALVIPTREGRSIALGRLKRRKVAVIFKPLGSEAISIISFRTASKKERREIR